MIAGTKRTFFLLRKSAVTKSSILYEGELLFTVLSLMQVTKSRAGNLLICRGAALVDRGSVSNLGVQLRTVGQLSILDSRQKFRMYAARISGTNIRHR